MIGLRLVPEPCFNIGFSCGLSEGEDDQECTAFTDFTGYLNPPMMFLDDPAGQ